MLRFMKIRNGIEDDKENFVKLYLSCFVQTNEQTVKTLFEEKLSNPMTGIVLVAEENGELIGSVAVDIIELTGHIVGLCVRTEDRQKGIGTALIKNAIETTTKMNRNVRHLVMTGGKYTTQIAKKFGFAQNTFVWVKYV